MSEEVCRKIEEVGDVQARQELCVDIAILEACEYGFDWMVHIDIDELLYFPKAEWEDARHFFRQVPDEKLHVRFWNLECAPESWDVEDWFKEFRLFGLHVGIVMYGETCLLYTSPSPRD